MELKRIHFSNSNTDNNYPNFENQLDTRYIFENDELKSIYEAHKNELIDTATSMMHEYLNDPELCNDSEDSFPQPKFLTGEWYLSSVNFEDDWLNLCVRFIGIDTGSRADYLGLEINFVYDKDSGSFDFDGIDSESL
ncbi:MAG: hypothetical protein SPK70_07790 [Succinivibrio dextrinosolvens]|nr:hypothetical protein [Succinivibrio dextrinosolvens]